MWCFSSYLPTINLVLFVFLFPSRMIENSSLSPTREVFMRVAYEIFSDGKFNWGRVVALFYFACRLVIKVRLFFQKLLKFEQTDGGLPAWYQHVISKHPGSGDPSPWHHQNHHQLDRWLPSWKCNQLDHGARWLGEELNQLMHVCSPDFYWLREHIVTSVFYFEGGHSFLLWHSHMADGGSFLGWRSHHCHCHTENVKGLRGWTKTLGNGEQEGP